MATRSSIKVLLTIRGKGFVSTFWAESARGENRFDGVGLSDFLRSVEQAHELIQPFAAAYGVDDPYFRLTLEKTDLYKDWGNEASVDGKSAGFALFLLMFSRLLSLPLRSGLAVTGCLEPSGDVTYVPSIDKKLFDDFGAAHRSDVNTVVVPPEPRTETGNVKNDRARYKAALGYFPSIAREKDLFVLSSVSEVFSESVFPKLFQGTDILRFIKDKGYLVSPEDIPRNTGDRQVDSFGELLVAYTQRYWELVDDAIQQGPEWLDIYTETGHAEALDLLLQLFEAKATGQLIDCLTVFNWRFSGQAIAEIFGDHILAALEHNYLRHVPHVLAQCQEDLDHSVRTAGSPSLSPLDYVRIAERSYQPYQSFLHSLVSLLSCIHEMDSRRAIEIVQSTDIFESILANYMDASGRIHDERATVDDYVTVRVYGPAAQSFAALKRYFLDSTVLHTTTDGDVQASLDPPPPCMDIRVPEDLSELEFHIDEQKVQSLAEREAGKDWQRKLPSKGNNAIGKPCLLWQESGKKTLPFFYQFPEYDPDCCAILNLPDGHIEEMNESGFHKVPGLIQDLFGSQGMTISYGQGNNAVSVYWSNYHRWPPSIDSLWFASVLREHASAAVRSAVDIGCGTGFLGIFLAKHLPHLRFLFMTDVQSSLVLLARHNAEANLRDDLKNGLRCEYVTGAGLAPLRRYREEIGEPFDLIVCAPPYLPRTREHGIHRYLAAAVSGTALLEELVLQGRKYTRELLLQFSEMAIPEFMAACRRSGVVPTRLATLRVPLRIPPIMPWHPRLDLGLDSENENERARYYADLEEYERLRKYHDFLLDEKRIRVLNQANFKFWHELSVFSVKF